MGWLARLFGEPAPTAQDVERAIANGFPAAAGVDIRAALDLYTDREPVRVRLAVLALAEGDPDKVFSLVEIASKDFRDVLYWAEYPEDSSGGRVTQSEMAGQYRRLGVPVPESLR